MNNSMIKLSDVADLTVGYVGNMTDQYQKEGVCFLRSLNIKPFGIDESDLLYISPEFNEKIKKSKLSEGDLVIVRTGTPGTCCVIPKEYDGCNCSDLVIIHPNTKLVDPYYLEAYINFMVQGQINNQKVGAIQKHFNINTAKDMLLFLPELDIQHEIAAISMMLNEKIKSNNNINLNLETLAKTIYDYWFLQFEFPNEEGKPYKSSGGKMVWNEELKQEIPEGWKIGKLNELAQITMGSSPNGGSINEENDGIAFFQGKTDFGLRFPTVRTYTNDPVRYAEANDVLLSVRAPVGDINVAEDKCCIGRGIAAIHSQYQSYIYYTLLANQAQFDKYNCSGTTFGALTKDDLFNLKIIIPNIKILRIFNTRVKEYDNLIRILEKESQYLISLRDFLLPLLMNGQIEIESN